MKNVLLLCLSLLRPKNSGNITTYSSPDFPDNENARFKGAFTNEAPAKSVIYSLYNNKQAHDKLDEIIMICSEATNEPITNLQDQTLRKALLGLDNLDLELSEAICKYDDSWDPNLEKELFSKLTTRSYYRYAVNSYLKEHCDSPYDIDFKEIEVSNTATENEIAEIAVQAANEITKGGEEVNLYIDFNGAQRYMAFMIFIISNLMKIRHVNIQQILVMNFDNKTSEGIVPIMNMKSVFGTVDLIAGINEYVNYGRIRGLREYFKLSNNDAIMDILSDMEQFSNNLQLCRTNYIMTEKENLYNKLVQYENDLEEKTIQDKPQMPDSQQNEKFFEEMFALVIKDILNEYRDFLTGDLPAMIKWCVEKDFIQQALTFCSEQLPGYFWESGIFKPTEKEEKEYRELLKALKKLYEKDRDGLNDWKLKPLKDSFLKSIDSQSVHSNNTDAYNWMIKYLGFSSTRPKDPKKQIDPDNQIYNSYDFVFDKYTHINMKDAFYCVGPGNNDTKRTWRNQHRNGEFCLQTIDLVENDIKKFIKTKVFSNKTGQVSRELYYNVGNRIWQARSIKAKTGSGRVDENVRATTNIADENVLWAILIFYFLLKQQRNMTNHADDSNDEELWSYQELRDVISSYADILRNCERREPVY